MAKPLCPVANVTLLDLALARLASIGADPAVNVHHHAEAIGSHVGERATISHERDEALGTAGALAALHDWIDGRPVAVVNADTWCPGGLAHLVEGWDGERVRVLVPGRGAFGPRSPVVGTLLPWRLVEPLLPTPSGLYELVWRDEAEAGRLEVVAHDGPWADCGTPEHLLETNLMVLDGGSVIDPSAEVGGTVERSAVAPRCLVAGQVADSVLFPGAVVAAGETLDRAIRWPTPQGQQTLHL